MTTATKWYDNRELFSAFLTHLVVDEGYEAVELLDVVRNPSHYHTPFKKWQQQQRKPSHA